MALADAVRLRRARPEDAAAIAAVYAPYVRDTTISFETEPPPAEEIGRRMAEVAASGLPWIVAEAGDGQLAGYTYAHRFHPRAAYRFTVETAIYLAAGHVGRGLGAALYDRLLTMLTELGYAQAIALVTLPNAPSEALHRRCGFMPTGRYVDSGYKMGRWIDVGLFQRPLRTLSAGAVTEPIELAASATWRALD